MNELSQVDELLAQVDGIMIGRQAYQRPYFLAELEQHLCADWTAPSREAVVDQMMDYAEAQVAAGETLPRITRHMMGLFAGLPGARAWRRYLSENAYQDNAGPDVMRKALSAIKAVA